MSTASTAFDAALAAWLARQAVAEGRLTAFAFGEGQPVIDIPAPSSHGALRGWLLETVAADEVIALLRRLGSPGLAATDLVAGGALGIEAGDRVALMARIGVLAASGLVARDLEGDRVTLTELGGAALALVSEGAPAAAVTTPRGPAQ